MTWTLILIWLALQPVIVLACLGIAKLAERREKKRRRSLARRLVASATLHTLVDRPIAGPTRDALRAVKLRALLDKTEPSA